MSEGQTLKKFIDNQKITKVGIAKDLGITKQTLFQYFKSQYLEPETKKRFEDYFGVSIFTDRATVAAVIAATGSDEKVLEDPPQYSARTSLERTLENLSEDKLKSTAIIERLVSLLEKQLGENTGPFLVPPGTPGTIPINKKQEKTSR